MAHAGTDRAWTTWIAESLVDLAALLRADFAVPDVLSLLSRRLVALLGAADAGLLLVNQGESLQVLASSSSTIHALEQFEIEHAEGPCVDVLRSGRAVVNAPLDDHRRWPAFAPAARAAGYHRVHALPLHHNRELIGVANIFGHDDARLNHEMVAAGQALADIASFALAQERALRDARELAAQLRQALRSRVVLEQAKGVLSAQLGIEVDDAFELLRRYARNRNERVANVASEVVRRRLRAADLVACARSGKPRS